MSERGYEVVDYSTLWALITKSDLERLEAVVEAARAVSAALDTLPMEAGQVHQLMPAWEALDKALAALGSE